MSINLLRTVPPPLFWLSDGGVCFFLKRSRLVCEWASLALCLHHESERARLRWYTKVMIPAVWDKRRRLQLRNVLNPTKRIRGFGEIRLRVWLSPQFSGWGAGQRARKQSKQYMPKPDVCLCLCVRDTNRENRSAKICGKALMNKTAVQWLKISVRDSCARAGVF